MKNHPTKSAVTVVSTTLNTPKTQVHVLQDSDYVIRRSPKQALIVHCKRSKYDVCIGSPGKWGNPFVIGKDGNRATVILSPEELMELNDIIAAARMELSDIIGTTGGVQ